jgi:erythromycin esterase
VDLDTPARPARHLREIFEGATDVPTPDGDLEAVQALDGATPEEDGFEAAVADAMAAVDALREHLDAHAGALRTATSAADLETARYLCRVARQTCEWLPVRHREAGPHEAGMAARDRFMAANVAWAHATDRGDGVAVWAHDAHVQRGTFDDGQVWTDGGAMGDRLADRFGDDYVPLGFDFGCGRFRAVHASEGGEPRAFAVGDPDPDWATAVFDALADGPVLVDLASAAADPRIADWLDEPGRKRWVGSWYAPDADPATHTQHTRLADAFGHLVVLPDSSPTVPLED